MSKYISTSIYLILGVLIAGLFMWGQDSLAVSTINISKETDPSGFGDFNFNITGPDTNTDFSLDDGDPPETFSDRDPGDYTVTETPA